ncbi:hypothetical protein RE628_16125 [Paenibacillus sp. D2_2]|uniref:hypothetical protein n=1 Tax=Paenibacillus sp. D2_2 TaxID=3073092 RepID=UPI00281591BD|nr:hypothetical protein [Paenibacillus sp. D2_2]WMT39045.1 hypothetical protein RE628_16125 [Paenibacillus sp. D2_2]
MLLTAQTTFRSEDPRQEALNQMEAAKLHPYSTLLDSHTADHRKLFDRVSLEVHSDDTAGEAEVNAEPIGTSRGYVGIFNLLLNGCSLIG